MSTKIDRKFTNYYIKLLLEQLNSSCFDVRYPVIRVTDSKKGKAKELLVAAGSGQLMKEKDEVEIFEREALEVQGRTMYRPIVVGECEVEIVEGAHFSKVKVKSGGEVIQIKINSGTPLFCRLKTKF